MTHYQLPTQQDRETLTAEELAIFFDSPTPEQLEAEAGWQRFVRAGEMLEENREARVELEEMLATLEREAAEEAARAAGYWDAAEHAYALAQAAEAAEWAAMGELEAAA